MLMLLLSLLVVGVVGDGFAADVVVRVVMMVVLLCVVMVL